jgi:hypothetical protein
VVGGFLKILIYLEEKMDEDYWVGLANQTDRVFKSHPDLYDHRPQHPWARGAHGDPHAGIWLIAENPSLTQVERVRDPHGGPPTIESQWWSSEGDKLLRKMLVKFDFKSGPFDSPGGWKCYITNVIKEADYTQHWREKTQPARNQAAEIWSGLLDWELKNSRPRLVVIMGGQTRKLLDHLQTVGKIKLPHTEQITHYAYIGQRPQGSLGPMHPQRVNAYEQEFARIRMIFDTLSNDQT